MNLDKLGTDTRNHTGLKNMASRKGIWSALESNTNQVRQQEYYDSLGKGMLKMKFFDEAENEIRGPIALTSGSDELTYPDSQGYYTRIDEGYLSVLKQEQMEINRRVDRMMEFAVISTTMGAKVCGMSVKDFKDQCKVGGMAVGDDTDSMIDDEVNKTNCEPDLIHTYTPHSEKMNRAILKLRTLCRRHITAMDSSGVTGTSIKHAKSEASNAHADDGPTLTANNPLSRINRVKKT